MILAVVWACSDDGKKGEAPPGPDPEVPDVVMKNAMVYGLVKDIDGVLLSGVKVTTGTLSAITDAMVLSVLKAWEPLTTVPYFVLRKPGILR